MQTKMMKLEQIKWKPDDNLRQKADNYNYERGKDKDLMVSIAEIGLQDPLVLSMTSGGKLKKQLKGYRRLGAILALKEKGEQQFPDDAKKQAVADSYRDAFNKHFHRTVDGDTGYYVPVMIYTGLSELEELQIMADHTTVKGLSEQEVYNTACRFFLLDGKKAVEELSKIGIASAATLYKYRKLYQLSTAFDPELEYYRFEEAKRAAWDNPTEAPAVPWEAVEAAYDAAKANDGLCPKGNYQGKSADEILEMVLNAEKPVRYSLQSAADIVAQIKMYYAAGELEQAHCLEWVLKLRSDDGTLAEGYDPTAFGGEA